MTAIATAHRVAPAAPHRCHDPHPRREPVDHAHHAVAHPHRRVPGELRHLAHRAHGGGGQGRWPRRLPLQRRRHVGGLLHGRGRRAGHEPDLQLCGGPRRHPPRLLPWHHRPCLCGLALMYGVGVALLAGVERATDGWGVDGWFFAPGPFASMPLWEVAASYTLVLLFMFFVGSAVGAVFVRWGASGIITFFASRRDPGAGGALGDHSGGRVELCWPLLHVSHDHSSWRSPTLPFAVVGGVVGYALMRRATPKG